MSSELGSGCSWFGPLGGNTWPRCSRTVPHRSLIICCGRPVLDIVVTRLILPFLFKSWSAASRTSGFTPKRYGKLRLFSSPLHAVRARRILSWRGCGVLSIPGNLSAKDKSIWYMVRYWSALIIRSFQPGLKASLAVSIFACMISLAVKEAA